MHTTTPIPPLLETTLEPHLMDYLTECLQEMIPGEITVLPLIRKCTAVSVDGNILGSKQSHYTTSSVVMAHKPPNTADLGVAEIQFFFWCDVLTGDDMRTFAFVALCFYDPHKFKPWFGFPTEVWSAVTSPDISFVPLDKVKSRVAYSKQTFYFGRVIGEDSVMIVSPLSTPLS